jgi:hypothetical protein
MSKANTDEIRKTNKTDPSLVKDGDLMAITYYVKVETVRRNGEQLSVLDVVGDTGGIDVNGKSLIANALSADQFAETIKVTKTQCAQLLIESTNRPFTVTFEKQDGTERKLRGRLISHEALLGRSMVEDLDIDRNDKKGRTRLVDHRTLKSLIVDGVKYEVKDK